jgi:hypothetical protein
VRKSGAAQADKLSAATPKLKSRLVIMLNTLSRARHVELSVRA